MDHPADALAWAVKLSPEVSNRPSEIQQPPLYPKHVGFCAGFLLTLRFHSRRKAHGCEPPFSGKPDKMSTTTQQNSDNFGVLLKSYRKKYGFTQEQLADALNITRSYLSEVENGEPCSPRLQARFQRMAQGGELVGKTSEPDKKLRKQNLDLGVETIPLRRIPLLSWAQAGEAVEYDEVPMSWQKTVPTDLDDPKAFAVTIAGDSMEDRYEDGDIAILNPSAPFKQNGLVVAVLDDPSISGTVFKLCSRDGKSYHFSSLNPAYKAFEVGAENVKRLYRVHSVMKIIK